MHNCKIGRRKSGEWMNTELRHSWCCCDCNNPFSCALHLLYNNYNIQWRQIQLETKKISVCHVYLYKDFKEDGVDKRQQIALCCSDKRCIIPLFGFFQWRSSRSSSSSPFIPANSYDAFVSRPKPECALESACTDVWWAQKLLAEQPLQQQYQAPQRHAAVRREEQQGSIIVHCSSAELRQSM